MRPEHPQITQVSVSPPNGWRRASRLQSESAGARLAHALRDRLVAGHGAAWTILALGMLWAMLYLWHSGHLFSRARFEEPEIGKHLALGHGFRSPYDASPSAPPSSWSPPVYPCVIAAAYWSLGVESWQASVLLGLLNALCYGAVGAGLFVIGRHLFSPWAGIVALVLFFAHPMFLRLTAKYWDAYLALAMFVWLMIGALRIRSCGVSAVPIAALGAGLGILSLTNASYVLAIPAIVLLATGGQRWNRQVKLVAVAAASFLIVLAPWTIRNYRTFCQVFFVRNGANLELWFGNLPESTGWLSSESFGRHPGHSAHERALLLQMGETAYFRYCGERFRAEYRRHSAAFWRRTLWRTAYLFISDPTEKAYYPYTPDWRWGGYVIPRVLINSLIAALGLGGAWAAHRLGHRATWLLMVALLSVVPFTVTAVWDRHTMPLRAALLVLSGFLLWAIAYRWVRGRWPASYRPWSLNAARSDEKRDQAHVTGEERWL